MRLKTVSVNDLFGIYKYEINLIDSDRSRVTIIDAPNGMGKTTMLRLIKATLEGDVIYLDSIPFSVFNMLFDNGKSISVSKKDTYASIQDNTVSKIRRKSVDSGSFAIESEDDWIYHGNIVFSIDEKQYPVSLNREFYSMIMRTRRMMAYSPEKTPIRYYIEDRNLTTEEVFSADDLLLALSDFRKEFNIYFIETNRLFKRISEDEGEGERYRSARGDYSRKNMVSAVELYRRRIQEMIVSAGKDFADKSEELDRSFPQRVLDVIFDKDNDSEIMTKDQIVAALKDLEQRRFEFGELGLITDAKDSMLSIPENKDLTNETRIFLTKYIDDNVTKLQVYSDLFDKLNILRTIVNKRNVFSDKEMRFDAKDGIVFVSKNDRPIPVEKLSSGEKNNFVLFYELIFECKDNSLILVDEPEISLHVAWQNQYISELNEICDIKHLQGIVATHSPDIVNDYDDCMVDLEDLNDGEQE